MTILKTHGLLLLVAGLAAAGIFIVELFTPLGMAIGLLYVPVLLLSLWVPYRATPYVGTALFSFMIVLGYLNSPPGLAEEIGLFNRTLSIIVLWIVALLCDMWRQTRRAAQALEERFHLLVEGVRDYAIIMLDPAGRILTWNVGAKRITGYEEEEAVGRSLSMLYLPDDYASGEPLRQLEVTAGAGRFEQEGGRQRKDGSRFLAYVVMTPLRDEHGGLRGFSKVMQDITDRRKAEEEREQLFNEVQAGQTRLQALSNQLIETQEVERRHLARELHDEIGQALSTLKILIQKGRQGTDPASAVHLEEGVEIVNQTIDQVRALSLDLRPSVLDDLGLIPALRWFVDNKTRQAGIAGEFVSGDIGYPLTPERTLVCFRLVQEAVTNVMRHAKAKRLSVVVTPGRFWLEITIRDDGIGFDVGGALLAASGGKTMGLLGMQERVKLVGGELDLHSTKGNGSEIRARFPTEAPDEAGQRSWQP